MDAMLEIVRSLNQIKLHTVTAPAFQAYESLADDIADSNTLPGERELTDKPGLDNIDTSDS